MCGSSFIKKMMFQLHYLSNVRLWLCQILFLSIHLYKHMFTTYASIILCFLFYCSVIFIELPEAYRYFNSVEWCFSKACESELMHYSDVIMGAMTSQITSLTIVYSMVYSGADKRKHQSFASLAFVRGIHRWPVNSQHKGPVMRKMFPFDDIIIWKYNVTKEGKCCAMLSHSAIVILFPDNW